VLNDDGKPRRYFRVLDGPYKGSSRETGPTFTSTAIVGFAIVMGAILVGLALCH
jgi:hypothetical protein